MGSGFLVIAGLLLSNGWAQDLSINQGKAEEITGWNNQAISLGGEAEEWKKKWPIQKIKKKPDGSKTEEGIRFCLSPEGAQRGSALVGKINDVSLSYEGYMGKFPGAVNDSIKGAYGNNESNLHSLNDYVNRGRKEAGCPK